jgi:SAM-dependent methyltransferase
VVGADLAPGRIIRTEVPVVTLNLHAPLPFQDATFDAVVGIEGIEHLENPYLPTREFFRVLRPGGLLILSTPNVLNLRSRMKFLAWGTMFWFDERSYRRGFHINAIPVYELRHILTEAGFRLESVRVNRQPLPMRAMAALVGPLLRAAARAGGRDPSLNACALLSGEVLLVRARKGSGT